MSNILCPYCNKLTTVLSKHNAVCKDYKIHILNLENSITKEYLISEYIENGKSINFLTNELGFKNSRNIHKLLSKFEIPIRGIKESTNKEHCKKIKIETNIEKYGTNHVLQNKEVKQKSKITLQKNHGVDNISKVQKIKDKKQNTMYNNYGVKSISQLESTKTTLQNNYGVTNVFQIPEVIKKCQESKLNSNKPSVYFSKQSQQLFWSIYDKLPKELQDHCYFAELNKEYGRYDQENKKYYFYDFVITNIKYCIEYNGNYYHANPKKYDESFYNKHLNLTSQEIWNKDKVKNDFLINDGFSLNIVWENTENELVVDSLINNILLR